MPDAVVTLTIEKAEALVALNPGGTSNPFFTATIGAQSVTTPVVHKTVNPVFNATFTFHGCPLPAMVTLRAFNKIQFVDIEDPLGTATVTLLDVQPETTTKVVQLSHGGVAALAQRAPNGCGTVTVSYSVTLTPAQEAAPTVENAASKPIDLPSFTAVPIPVPTANNIDATSPVSIPVASVPQEGAAGMLGSSSHLLASNPSATNPAATTARLKPDEGAPAAAVEGAAFFSSALSVTPQQRSQLTPPSLTPAQPPATATYLVPQVAPPPSSATVNVSVKSVPTNGYESYAVQGAKLPPPPMCEGAVAASDQVPSPRSVESYYANNTAHNASAAPPSSSADVHLSGSVSMLPVAPNIPASTRFASLQESTSAALSFDAQQQQTASASSLYTSAAQAPTTASQTRLLVIPPHIDGAVTPTFHHASQASSREGSRLPSAAQLPTSTVNPSDSFPAHAQPPLVTGALPVATAPRSPPLTSSTTSSLRSTPAAQSSHIRYSAGSFTASPFLAENVVAASLSASTCAAATRRGVAPASATAGLQHSSGAAFPNSAHHCGNYASVSVASGTTSPKRCSPRNESERCAEVSSIPSASKLYADREYLLEVAATGADVDVFLRLRQVDPTLTNGFLECLDYSGRSLLHIAAWNGQLRLLQILLSPEPAEPMIDLRSVVTAKSGNTILHAAACGGQAEVAQWLRYSHPTAGPLLLSMRNARNMTAAECAMEAGFPHVARLLMPN